MSDSKIIMSTLHKDIRDYGMYSDFFFSPMTKYDDLVLQSRVLQQSPGPGHLTCEDVKTIHRVSFQVWPKSYIVVNRFQGLGESILVPGFVGWRWCGGGGGGIGGGSRFCGFHLVVFGLFL